MRYLGSHQNTGPQVVVADQGDVDEDGDGHEDAIEGDPNAPIPHKILLLTE